MTCPVTAAGFLPPRQPVYLFFERELDMTSKRPGRARIGTSGYQYDHWKGKFYPEQTPKTRWFEYYRDQFDTVEINNTFYQLPQESTFDKWRERAPENFLYTLKFSRYGSHILRLREPEDTIRLFVQRAERLGNHLGPILVQLRPRWPVDVQRLREFMREMPATHRWAFEFRDPSWLCEEVYDLLRRHSAALCIHDIIKDHPRVVTADWIYFRFHGDHHAGSYSPRFLSSLAGRIGEHLANGLDVFAYFNNDAEAHAAANARDLRKYVEKISGPEVFEVRRPSEARRRAAKERRHRPSK